MPVLSPAKHRVGIAHQALGRRSGPSKVAQPAVAPRRSSPSASMRTRVTAATSRAASSCASASPAPIAITVNSSPPCRQQTSSVAQLRAERRRNRLQRGVPFVMADLVVDGLEPVEVEHDQREALVVPARAGGLGLERAPQHAEVAEAR